MSLVVVGTDTEVGKTVVSAVVLARYARRRRLAYWKPLATGADGDTDTGLVRKWVGHRVEVLEVAVRLAPLPRHRRGHEAHRLAGPRP